MSLFKSTKQIECCPDCQSPLQIKKGKQGLFLGCSNYPACHYIKPLQQINRVIKTLEDGCPECGHLLQLKQGHFGIFIGCSHYPECEFVVHNELDSNAEFICPECKKHQLVERIGRLGKHFYGCAGYPECKFTLPSEPIAHSCPQCDYTISIRKKVRGKTYFCCANKSCQYLFEIEE